MLNKESRPNTHKQNDHETTDPDSFRFAVPRSTLVLRVLVFVARKRDICCYKPRPEPKTVVAARLFHGVKFVVAGSRTATVGLGHE